MDLEGYGSLYACLLSSWVGSLRLRVRVIGGVSCPSILDSVSCRVWVMCLWFKSRSAFSFTTR